MSANANNPMIGPRGVLLSYGASSEGHATSTAILPKPKWMREATYDRKLEEIFAAEEIIYAHMEILDRKLDRLLGR